MSITSYKTGNISPSSLLVGNTAAPPSSPVAGYSLWLDADNAASFTYSSGTSVSQWTDRSGNAYAFTQATSTAQPNRNGSLNGKSTVTFDGGDRLASTAASSVWKYLSDGSTATVFFVAKRTGGAYLAGTQVSDSTQVGITFEYDSGTSFSTYSMRGVSGNITSANVAITNNSWNVFSIYLDQSNATTANKVKLYVGDASAATATGAYTPSSSNPQHTLYIGANSSGGYALTGEVAEILIYTSLLSETNRQLNVDYLQGKWGV